MLAALAAAAAADLARSRARDASELQASVGGFGAGGGLDFSGCPEDLDPRVEALCADRLSPLASGGAPCRRHAAAGRTRR